jgi:hypothetical protein
MRGRRKFFYFVDAVQAPSEISLVGEAEQPVSPLTAVSDMSGNAIVDIWFMTF